MASISPGIVPEVSPRPTALLTASATVISASYKGCRGESVEEIGLDVEVVDLHLRFAIFLCSR